MDQTTGQKLSKARLAKGLSIDEVAHVTKLRPDKILALEHDDYSRFPNNAYVKGFLQMYGRYLGVDVRAALDELENPSPVSISGYQYLNSVPEKEPERIALRRKTTKPSLAPLIVFVLLCFAVGGGGYLYLNAKRLGNMDQAHDSAPEPAAPAAAENSVTPNPAPTTAETNVEKTEKPDTETVPPAPEPGPVVSAEPGRTEVAAPPLPSPPAAVISEEAAAADHEFIAQTPPADGDASEPPGHDVVIEPLRKTWVTIRTGDMSSTPIFEDYLYTNAPPLKLRGPRFFIEVRDEGAVSIRKNGAPIAYQGAGVTIQ